VEPILIGLNGKARSGKDTFANFMEEYAKASGKTFAREAFARRLKESAAHALGVFEDEVTFCDSLKGEYERCTIQVRAATKAEGPNSIITQVTGREYLQNYGTEAHRDVFGSNFWVDAVLPLTYEFAGYVDEADAMMLPAWQNNFLREDQPTVADICVITDVRFPNEAERIKDLGGQVWKIHRDGSGAGEHASEQELPGELIDMVIDNNGTLDSLRGSAYYILENEEAANAKVG
jgi:hypothetical protein